MKSPAAREGASKATGRRCLATRWISCSFTARSWSLPTETSYRELAERYGVAPSLVAKYSKEHNCLGRRKQAKKRAQALACQKERGAAGNGGGRVGVRIVG